MTPAKTPQKPRKLRIGAADLNGQARGKILPKRFSGSIEKSGVRTPYSVMNLDIWGEDIEGSPLVYATGDADGVLLPTGRGYVPMPWLSAPSALLPAWMFHEDGTSFAGDPRQALATVVARYAARGLTPVVATEMEFYLVDDSGTELRPPKSPLSGKRALGAEILSLRELDTYDAFFDDVYAGCIAMDIPAEAAISEGGPGQFEICLEHQADALKAADDAWLFKMLVRGMARSHGMAATFMAKPYAKEAGNGLHSHFSVLDTAGRNIFDDGSEAGTPQLRHAIAGCLSAAADCALVFAPHGNSYERLQPHSHAPTGICWAYENRTAAIRVPGGNPAARRIEHRMAGGDVNPYLFLAAILGAALNGIEDTLDPPAPISGNAYAQDLPQLPTDWAGAIERFAQSPLVKRIFPDQLAENFVQTKRQELRRSRDLSPEELQQLYLEAV